jgi:hypothetical protein
VPADPQEFDYGYAAGAVTLVANEDTSYTIQVHLTLKEFHSNGASLYVCSDYGSVTNVSASPSDGEEITCHSGGREAWWHLQKGLDRGSSVNLFASFKRRPLVIFYTLELFQVSTNGKSITPRRRNSGYLCLPLPTSPNNHLSTMPTSADSEATPQPRHSHPKRRSPFKLFNLRRGCCLCI